MALMMIMMAMLTVQIQAASDRLDQMGMFAVMRVMHVGLMLPAIVARHSTNVHSPLENKQAVIRVDNAMAWEHVSMIIHKIMIAFLVHQAARARDVHRIFMELMSRMNAYH